MGGVASFYGCVSLKRINFPASLEEIGVFAFAHSYGLEKIIFKKGSKLEYIGESAFYVSENLKTVILPPSVKEIGVGAFSYSGLEKIIFKKGSKIETIGYWA